MCQCPAARPLDTPAERVDLPKLREDFPVLHQLVRGKPLAYLDNAATSQKPVRVIQAVCDYYGTCNANVHRAFHYLAEESTRRYEAARRAAAAFLGAASPREIIFTRGTTEGINLVAWGWGRKSLRSGDVILLTEMEHHSNLVPWQLVARATGAKLKFIPVLEDGTLDLDRAAAILKEDHVRLVAFTHASNVLGTINPVAELVRMARAAGAVSVVDGAQSAPHLPISVRDLGCDFFACSGHKMFGPTGIGLLYARADLQEQMDPFLAGGEMIDRVELESSTWAEIPHKFEAGTPNISAAIGLHAAIQYLEHQDREALADWERQLTEMTIRRLEECPGVRILGPRDHRVALVSFTVEGVHPHDLAQFLDGEGVAVRAGHLCCQPLLRRFGVPAVTRASFAFYNVPEEVDRLVQAVQRSVEYFRRGT